MSELTFANLLQADGEEVTDRLVAAGITSVATRLNGDGLHVTVPDAQDQLARDTLAGWTPTALRGSYIAPLPAYVKDHTQHLRDYLNAATPTNAETVHVVKDLIRVAFFTNKRLENE